MNTISPHIIASIVNNSNSKPKSPDWKHNISISIRLDRIELATNYTRSELPWAQWRLELDPAIPNRAILHHLPTNATTFLPVNPWIALRTLRLHGITPPRGKTPPALPPPPPGTDFILIHGPQII